MQERTGRRTAYLLTNWYGNEKPDLNLSKIMCSSDGFYDRDVLDEPLHTLRAILRFHSKNLRSAQAPQ